MVHQAVTRLRPAGSTTDASSHQQEQARAAQSDLLLTAPLLPAAACSATLRI